MFLKDEFPALLPLSICRAVCLSFCLSFCLCLSVFLSFVVYLSVCLSVSSPVCLFVCLSVSFSLCLSVCLSLSVWLFVRVSVCLSVCFSLSLRQNTKSVPRSKMELLSETVFLVRLDPTMQSAVRLLLFSATSLPTQSPPPSTPTSKPLVYTSSTREWKQSTTNGVITSPSTQPVTGKRFTLIYKFFRYV